MVADWVINTPVLIKIKPQKTSISGWARLITIPHTDSARESAIVRGAPNFRNSHVAAGVMIMPIK